MKSLIAQGEASEAIAGYWYGLEVLEEDGRYFVVLHTSVYTRMQRTFHHASGPVSLEATDAESALGEARKALTDYIRRTTGAVT